MQQWVQCLRVIANKRMKWVMSLPYNFLFSFTVLNLEFGGLLCICVVLTFSFSNDLHTLRLNKLKLRRMRSHICLPLFKEFPFDNFSSQKLYNLNLKERTASNMQIYRYRKGANGNKNRRKFCSFQK